jgi:predicted DsbA family dithiol-disulfide isomerase
VQAKRRDPNNPLKARAKKLGLTMVEGDVVPSTRRAHEAVEFARARGKLEEMHAALLRRYWSLGQDLYKLDTLAGAAVEAGLDPKELQEAIETGQYTAEVERLVREAQELGVFAVPMFLVGNKFVIEGAQELPLFREAMRRIGEKPKDQKA